MTKLKLKQEIIKISSLNKQELNKYAQNLYLAKLDIKEKAFRFLERACDLRQMQLEELDVSPMAVISELSTGEV